MKGMAKSKVSNSDVRAYLQQRKKSLQAELKQIEEALGTIDGDEKSGKKGKKKDQKKLKKAVKAIRKKVTKVIQDVKEQAESLVDNLSSKESNTVPVAKPSETDAKAASDIAEAKVDVARKPEAPRRRRVKEAASEPVSAPAVDEAVLPEERGPKRRRQATKPKAAESAPKQVSEEKATPEKATGNMDERIRHALGQKGNVTKEGLIDLLHASDPDYGLPKLKKVVAFRLNHLVKTGQIKRKENKTGIRYTI